MKRFQHTPDSAARAVRIGYNCGALGRIATTAEEFDEQNAATSAASVAERLAGANGWANAFVVCQLVKEQCGAPASTPEIRSAIETHFPELFADYWENIFAGVSQ